MTKAMMSEESIRVAEEAREKEEHDGFIASLFEAKLNEDFFDYKSKSKNNFVAEGFLADLQKVLIENVDPNEVDKNGYISEKAIEELRKIKAFGIKIPITLGGLGLSQSEYHKVAIMIGSFDASVTAILSAHNSIGAPEPIKKFGNTAQKDKYLPELAKGNLSGFALTEDGAGCDISQLKSYAIRLKEKGKLRGYYLTGEKLYTTNAPKNDSEFLAKFLIVIARIVDDPKELDDPNAKPVFGAFIVRTDQSGVSIKHKLDFMGIKGIYNGIVKFSSVYITSDNLLGEEGDGLKIALTTLTVGRMTLPAACLGMMKKSLYYAREWARSRSQWDKPIGQHELIAEKIVRMAARIVALEAIVTATGVRVDKKRDVRLESAAAKILGTQWAWDTVNDLLQIRGGRGYETVDSQKKHQSFVVPAERMVRDARINLIFEGTNEIMTLWIGREGMAGYIDSALKLQKGDVGGAGYILKTSASALNIFGWVLRRPQYRYIARKSHALVRSTLLTMIRYRQGMQFKQLAIKRLVDTALDLFSMTAALTYADEFPERGLIKDLADYFFEDAKRRINGQGSLVTSDPADDKVYKLAKKIMDGKAKWLEEGII